MYIYRALSLSEASPGIGGGGRDAKMGVFQALFLSPTHPERERAALPLVVVHSSSLSLSPGRSSFDLCLCVYVYIRFFFLRRASLRCYSREYYSLARPPRNHCPILPVSLYIAMYMYIVASYSSPDSYPIPWLLAFQFMRAGNDSPPPPPPKSTSRTGRAERDSRSRGGKMRMMECGENGDARRIAFLHSIFFFSLSRHESTRLRDVLMRLLLLLCYYALHIFYVFILIPFGNAAGYMSIYWNRRTDESLGTTMQRR